MIAVRDWRAGWRQVGAQLRPPSIPGAALAALVPCALGATLLWPPRPLLLWNASPSSPVGLYVVRPVGDPRVGDVVVAFALLPARRLAAARGYLPFAVPLVKSVAAASGDIVCARGTKVRINGRVAAVRRGRDPAGRPMPGWFGCRRLGRNDFLLLSTSPLAFDGRYFGISKTADAIGTARLLWRR